VSRYNRTFFCVYIRVFIRDVELPCHVREAADLANNMEFFAAAANSINPIPSSHHC